MLYTAPKSTFHHVVLSGALRPIAFVLIHVTVFLSTALLASYKRYEDREGYIGDCEATALKDKSSVKKQQHIS